MRRIDPVIASLLHKSMDRDFERKETLPMTNEPEPNTRAGEALKPCPFCGGEAVVEQQGTARCSHIIACTDCGARLETGEVWNAGSSWNTRPLPQPSELVAEVKRLTALADDHFRNARRLSEVVVARDAQIAKLQADGDKLAGALDRSRQGWSNVLELGLLPVQHQSTALGLQEAANQALTEWKDRA